MKLERFDPPGRLDDLDADGKVAWSRWISGRLDDARRGDPDRYENDGPREQFYNPMAVDTDEDAQAVDIVWTGFPRQVASASVSDVQRWRVADSSRDHQDEYCEWSVERDPETEKVRRVTFTCEGPEYWQFLAAEAPETTLDLYRRHVSPAVEMADLYDDDGRYVERNRFNVSTANGAMHLIQENNTLAAEIELAGGSSVVRVIGGRTLAGEQELIRCGRYGAAGRNSDPHIGAQVNSLTRRKADVTLADPVGLYFAGLVTPGWEAPDGSDPQGFWRYVRGTPEHPVRAVYEVPEDRGFVVGDLKIDGRPIRFGGQIADFVSVKLTGIGCRFEKSAVAPMTGCRAPRAQPLGLAGFGAERSVAAALRARTRARTRR